MKPNNAINPDSKKGHSFVATLFGAGYGERWASSMQIKYYQRRG
jgi:hypothetical protein